MPIEPDTKSWTWVLERACPDCGFDASTLPHEEVASLVRADATDWQSILARPADELRRRPSDQQWSALEYACHVRDVYRVYAGRLALMVTGDDPMFPNWDQDASAVADRYNEQDPATVADELHAAAATIAADFDALTPAQWSRPGRRSDGAAFTIDTIARYMVHDPVHHVFDVTGVAQSNL